MCAFSSPGIERTMASWTSNVDCLRIDAAADGWMRRHFLHAAAEHQIAAVFCIAEALRADAVECKKGPVPDRLHNGEGEITLHQRRQLFAVAHPAVGNGDRRVLVAGDEGEAVIEKAGAAVERCSQAVLHVDVGLAEA